METEHRPSYDGDRNQLIETAGYFESTDEPVWPDYIPSDDEAPPISTQAADLEDRTSAEIAKIYEKIDDAFEDMPLDLLEDTGLPPEEPNDLAPQSFDNEVKPNRQPPERPIKPILSTTQERANQIEQLFHRPPMEGLPIIPPPLDKDLLFRRQMRLNFTLVTTDQGILFKHKSTITPADQRLLYEHDPAVPTGLPEDKWEEKFQPQEEGDNLFWRNNEMAFIIDNLSDKQRKELEQSFMDGEQVHFSFIYGPKQKITKFDGKYSPAIYVTPDSAQKAVCGLFPGANYAAFTKMILTYNDKAELCITEKLMAEINVGTKTGSWSGEKLLPWMGGKVPLHYCRDLPSLINRNQNGEPGLPEIDRLHNQPRKLFENGLSKKDKRWIREGLFAWLDQTLDKNNYLLKNHYLPTFILNKNKEPVGQGHEKADTAVNFSRPLRLNVKAGGYLEKVLRNQAELTHLNRRARKLEHFTTEVYPAFKTGLISHGEISELARQLTRSSYNIDILFNDKYQNNLAYLLYFFETDPDPQIEALLGPNGSRGNERAEQIWQAILQRNQALAEKKSRFAQDKNYLDSLYQSSMAKIAKMTTDSAYMQLAELISTAHQINVSGPIKGPHHPHLQFPALEKDQLAIAMDGTLKLQGKLSRSNVKLSKEPRKIVGFDISPKMESLQFYQDMLAKNMAFYALSLAREGGALSSHFMWNDTQPRETPWGTIITGRDMYTLGRKLHRTPGKHKHKESSLISLSAAIEYASKFIEVVATTEPDKELLIKTLDYAAYCRNAREHAKDAGDVGEIFTHLVLEKRPEELLKGAIKNPDQPCQLVYADLIRTAITEYKIWENRLALEHPEGKKTRPDFIVTVGDQEILIDSKSWIKNFTVEDVKEIYRTYAPHLQQPGRQLVIIWNSLTEKIKPEAIEKVNELGIHLVTCDTMCAVLTKIDMETTAGESLAADYAKFVKNGTAFALDENNLEQYGHYRVELTNAEYDKYATLFPNRKKYFKE
ncbi:MAG: hypothetical protein WC805_01085 [Patescibacteria group bacterium]|jgi:hypothetical protein